MQKMIFVLELKMILSSRQGKAITSKVCLARSKLFPGNSQQPASTIMNWNNIYWKGTGGGGLLLDGFGVIHSNNLQHSHRILNYSLPQKSACVLTYGAEEDKEGTVASPSSMYLTNSLYTL